ncbi:MAG TPA: response regulator [Parafilimonas sp.]|nr:response regulator [Parafilimonas sp.]
MENIYRFIVIDDNPINVLVSEHIIKKVSKNAQIKTFALATLALQHIEEEYGKTDSNIPTLLFLDLHMPVMDGFEFLERFMKLDTDIQKQFKIIVLSATADNIELKKAIAYSCVTDYREKPLTIKVLKKLIEENAFSI